MGLLEAGGYDWIISQILGRKINISLSAINQENVTECIRFGSSSKT